jgi:hypothetical protein
MQAFCYAEGTAAAYSLALRARPDQAAFFELKTRETVRFALQMQYTPGSTYAFSRPGQVDGGIRYAMNETKVRIDYVHHALSAMVQWYHASATDPSLAPSLHEDTLLPQQVERDLQLQAKVDAFTAARSAVEAGEPIPDDDKLERPLSVPIKLLPPPRGRR